jgi:hypothetical protein
MEPEFFLASVPQSTAQIALDLKGNVLFNFPDGYYLNFTYPDSIRCYDSVTKKVSYINRQGQKIAFPFGEAEGTWFLNVAPDRKVKVLGTETDFGKFNSSYWKSSRTTPISRFDMFHRFLKEHDLIGMSKAEVQSFLGPDQPPRYMTHSFSYALDSGCVVDRIPCLTIKFESDKAIEWNIHTFSQRSESVRTNEPVDPLKLFTEKSQPTKH